MPYTRPTRLCEWYVAVWRRIVSEALLVTSPNEMRERHCFDPRCRL